jgi:hypothetical protein
MAWIDDDGDGFHDETGESRTEYNRRAGADADEAAEAEDRYMGRDGAPEGGWYGEDDAPLSEEEYLAERERQAGSIRDSRAGGASGSDPRYRSDAEYGISNDDADSALEGTFLLGDIGGSNTRQAARRQRRQDLERQGYIDVAEDYAPSADDLWVQYEEEGNIAGPERSELAGARADEGSIAAQRDALSELQAIYEGEGLTSADRARQQLLREQTGMATRAQREADQAMLAQRGMGSSGQSVASLLGGQQSGAQALSQADAQIQIDAQRRALQAMQAAGGLASDIRGQSFQEEGTRRGAADDFARYQTDYQRAREGRNTEWRNRTRESRASSRQQAFGNRKDIAALRTNQYGQGRDPSEVARESNEATGGLIQGIANMF